MIINAPMNIYQGARCLVNEIMRKIGRMICLLSHKEKFVARCGIYIVWKDVFSVRL